MIKDHTRDYATEAFRYYAMLGKTFEEVKEEIYNQAIEQSKSESIKTNNICSPTELAMMRAEKAVLEKKGELEDILAVEETLKQLALIRSGSEIKKIIELVYFVSPDKDIERNEFSNRVINASLELHCSESTVYRHLRKARNMFAENRGLRTSYRYIKNNCF